jgi:hypothetical protein
MGVFVGFFVGLKVEGLLVGAAEGPDVVGPAVGPAVGLAVVGLAVGAEVGSAVVGLPVGVRVGWTVVGLPVGVLVGPDVGALVGWRVVGLMVGLPLGTTVGSAVPVGSLVGEIVGLSVQHLPQVMGQMSPWGYSLSSTVFAQAPSMPRMIAHGPASWRSRMCSLVEKKSSSEPGVSSKTQALHVGEPVGLAEGTAVVGLAVGASAGAPVGASVGAPVGASVGAPVGAEMPFASSVFHGAFSSRTNGRDPGWARREAGADWQAFHFGWSPPWKPALPGCT